MAYTVVQCQASLQFSYYLIVQLSLWLRDVVEDLCQHKLRDVSDFEWQRYIRPYLSDDTRPPSVSEEGVECETRGIVMRCLDQELGYGYEYSGCDPLPVFTPHTDNYITSLTQVHNYTVVVHVHTAYMYTIHVGLDSYVSSCI